MKKLFMVWVAMIYSNLLLASDMGDGEHYSTPKAITYIIIGVILITVIATVLYKRPKRKFNE
ncbi:hypothetical protein H8S90_00240 [Olivibacter sp. SDN3]|uniref:hypothetical protein n=1 Tax=Olivibacter sp. SDN3 TaxID=2764720 RepID=UPI0016513970|nr:hypothetical protein [Olivibacter sp. SDN3]QNL50109.1 hypothetical protein H8S90_00240 [Olivibacter sp. SDN3]